MRDIILTQKQRWASVSVVIYILFVIAAIWLNFLDPAKIGLEWTIFWYFTAAGGCFYFYFKNFTYRETIYYAKKLGLHKEDLVPLIPKLKANQGVPDPDHPGFLSPFAKVPFSVLNTLTEQLESKAKAQGIPPFR